MEKYRAIPQGYMTAGAVAKKMGVTVRTLQHYDKEGLLSPSAMSEGGRRLYTDKDIIKLHQILSLKHLGFSLDDIRDRLISLDNPTDVAQILSEQSAIVREKIASLTELLSKIEALKTEVLEVFGDSRAEDDAYIRGSRLSRCARVSGNGMVLQSPTTKASPILTGNCAVYGKVIGDVMLAGSVVVISDETISNDSLDTLSIDERGRTVLRAPSRDKLTPRQPQEKQKRPKDKGRDR